MKLTRTQLAWAAGIVDGEGCISMSKNRVGENRRRTESYQIRLRVRMTHFGTVKLLHRMFGGYFTRHRPYNARARHTYLWYCSDRLTEEVVRRLLPFLVTRRKQALLVLHFRARCFGRAQRDWPKGTCPPHLVLRRRQFFLKMAALNKKGPR